ncbi:unnamed protein product [Polarella glacialis]|uniref:Uncharacterized protein n=1 Tax=Polarella glacialis TaxID=89957 RepID=A0A813G7W4_POLGL|nr:unnamed protein product [Polarella glacialis]|mmetsp:Transcript_6619/g.10596  ORF Transcript_6619/g.10596 Transcript_6619/m.10596 type:complete len:133 (-) Transcript_6619:479-877(-)
MDHVECTRALPETPDCVGMLGGDFVLKVTKITRAGDEVIELPVKGTDLVRDVIDKLEGTFQAQLRFEGSFEAFPTDLTLVAVGVCGQPSVELIISCMPLVSPPSESAPCACPEVVGVALSVRGNLTSHRPAA